MLKGLKKFWRKYKLKRSIEKQKFKLKLQSREDKLFTINIILYTMMFIFLLSATMFFILGPMNIITEYNYQVGKNDEVVDVVVDYCNYKDDDFDKIYCVNSFVLDNFNYVNTFETETPDELIENGGDCKSWSNFYLITLRQMGINVRQDYESVDKHTFIIADVDGGYCVIDQRSVDCSYLIENE